jgi:tRNA U34 5-carboxymethylaminomethyl modifying GTPase MnmE/TrmE
MPPWKLVRQGEIHATDVAYREAKERGLDLNEVTGTGFNGRIIADDVKKAAEVAQVDGATGKERTGQGLKVSEAAKRRAEEQIRKDDSATALVPTKSADELTAALKDCREAARVGYLIAKGNLAESTKAIDNASTSLSQRLKSLEDGSVGTPVLVTQLKEQLSDVIQELDQLHRAAEQSLEEQRERLDRFSITLFGRTMTGKSTLMEILTHGDGQSIGTGAQRTTRDVRRYLWNGLEVTDVPGVAAAVAGAEDEDLALRAAKQADLVLFLISDDAPQLVEVEWFADVRRLGKPVLGICNIKVTIDDEDDLLLLLRDHDKPFDHNRLDQLVQQFHAFADQRIPGNRVAFISTHLRSRFLADRPGFSKYRDQLLHASRFDRVESRIVHEVVSRGRFLRVKSFIDTSMVPMISATEALLEVSAQNSTDDHVLIKKQQQFEHWQKNFRTDGQEQINNFISREMEKLRQQVSPFAEDHYEDRSAGEAWNRLVERHNIMRKVHKLQEELNNECKLALSEFSREMRAELSLVRSFAGDRRIMMDKIFDLKRYWSWGASALVAASVFVSGPLGWAVAAAGTIGGLLSRLFTGREAKARRARAELAERLYANIDRMEKRLRQQLNRWFRKELVDSQVRILQNDLTAVTTVLFEIADAQRTLAWKLNDLQKMRGRTLIHEALRQLQETDRVRDGIRDVARVPGDAIMLLIEPRMVFPENVRADLERLLGEKVLLVEDTKNKVSILAQAIGQQGDKNMIRIEAKIQVARVVLDNFDPSTQDRVRLAQQLTGLHVML